MSERSDKHHTLADEIERQLPPELGLLFQAIRAEFDAKLEARIGKLTNRLLMMGIPIGAVGGFVAELVRPGTAQQALGLLPFV